MLYSGRGSPHTFRMTVLFHRIRQAALQALAHDVVNTAKAAAYSSMLMLFPAFLVMTTVIAQAEEGGRMLGGLRSIFDQFLPADTINMLQSSLFTNSPRSGQVLLSALSLSLFAALGVMLSFMEGFRRAYRLPGDQWGFWTRRARALLLVPIVMVPLAVASLLIVFGHQIELWTIALVGHDLRHIVLFFWRMTRWFIAMATSITVLTALYHFGTRRTERWVWVIPGAVAGTFIWFPSTLAFGWYVTRNENYSRFYGSFAAGIATLVWLYITSFMVLMGAELNGVLYRERQNQRDLDQQESPRRELSAADEPAPAPLLAGADLASAEVDRAQPRRQALR
jgi:membrane protein